MLTLPLVGLIAATAACEAGAQASLKLARSARAFLIPGIGLYIVVALLLHASYAYRGLGIVNALWSGTSVILMVAIGVFFFGERLSLGEYLGAALIVAGVVAIHASKAKG